jgi:hypothetical protein
MTLDEINNLELSKLSNPMFTYTIKYSSNPFKLKESLHYVSSQKIQETLNYSILKYLVEILQMLCKICGKIFCIIILILKNEYRY